MKKLFFLMAAAAALFTSCSKDDTIGGLSRGKVTFEVSAPELATRAQGDGTTATTLRYAVYDMVEDATNGKMVKSGVEPNAFTSGKASLSIDLVEGRTYEVAFWAESPNSPYGFDVNSKKVSYVSTTLTANNENYDAFFAYVGDDQNEKFEVGQTVNVTLKRPFAQLNIATNDTETAKDLDVEVVKTAVKVKAYTSFNLQTGDVVGSKTDVEFGLANQINGTLTSSSTEYDWLSMNYILTDGTNTDVTFTFTDAVNGTEEAYTRTYTAVPAKRNYRTNIIGSILTDPTVFELDIEEGFTQPDEEYTVGDVHKASSASDIQKIINEAPDGTPTAIVLEGNIDLSDMSVNTENTSTQLTTRAEADPTLTIAAGKIITLDLNGKTLSATSSQTGKNYNMIDVNGGTLTVKNGTITTNHTGDNMENSNSTNVFNVTGGGVLNLDSVTAKNLGGSKMAFVAHLNNWGEVTLNVNNSTLESTYIAVRVFNSGNDMNNVTIKNSTLKGGNRALWVHNYTLADFSNDATKTAAHQALLNFDIFNNAEQNSNNTFTVTDTVKSWRIIEYGFTNEINLDEQGRQIAVNKDMLQSALTYATEDITIYLANDITADEAIVIKENTNVKFTIDGQNHKFNGAFIIKGNSVGDDSKGILIKNINFESSVANFGQVKKGDGNMADVDAFVWSYDSSSGSPWRYANDVTIENCTFTATAGSAAEKAFVGVKFQQAYNIKVVNCTATNLHSLMQAESCGSTVTVEDCKVVNGKNGVSFNNTMNAIIKGTEIDAVGDGSYGVRHKGEVANYALTVENCNIVAFVPVLIRDMTATGYTATLKGENTLTTNSSNIYQIVLSNGDFDNETALAAPTGSYTLTGAEGFNVYPDSYESASYYAASNAQLSTAITAAISAAAASGDEDVVATVNLAEGSYEMPTPELRDKELTIIGSRDAVIDASKVDAKNQFVTGAALKFEGVTLNFGTSNYMGFANCASLTYKDCAINGLQFAYNPIVFDNCDFNSNGAEHCVWTYGAKEVTFNDCDFTYADRCVNVYLDNGTDSVKVDFSGCKFTNSDNETEGAVEINSSAFPKGANVNFTNCTAPSVGDMVFISKWDGTSGKTATVTVDGQTYNTPVHQ